MPKKPQDMLEFLRRNREELARATPAPPLPQRDSAAPAKKRPPDATPRKRPPDARKPAARGAPATAPPTAPVRPRAEPAGAHVVIALPRRKIWLAAGGAAALLLLVFWIGTKVGGNVENPDNGRFATPGGQAPFWTVRVVTLNEDEQSVAEGVVEAIASHRKARGLPELGLAIWPLERDGKLVVSIGSWPDDPKDDAQAREVLAYVRRLQDKETGRPMFAEAYFWQTPR